MNKLKNGAKRIFGEEFNKEFPKEGTEYITYNAEEDKYYAEGTELDEEEDTYILNNIEKNKKGYKIEIIEYLEDYSKTINQDSNTKYNIQIKNLKEENIFSISSEENEAKIIEQVKENQDRFSKKYINLIKNKDGNIFVESVEN